MKKYIELTEYDSDGRTVIFVDSIQGLCHAHDDEHHKDFTKVMVSGYTFAVNEPIGEILEKMESDQGHLDGIDVLGKIRAEIEQGYCEVEDNYDRGRNMGLYIAMQIIDHYKAESEEK